MTSSATRFESAVVDLLLNGYDKAVFVIDYPDRVIRACSDGVARVFGYQPAELIGHSTAVLHLDADSHRNFGERVQRELNQGKPFRGAFQARHRDGRVIRTMHHVVPIFDSSGRVSGNVSIIRNISGEEATRRLLELITDSLPIAVAIARIEDGQILCANRTFAQMFDIPPDDSVAGLRVTDFYARPEDREPLIETLRTLGKVEAEAQFRRRDGSLFWGVFTLHIAPFGGEPVVFGSLVDITAEREAQEAATQSRRRLEAIINNAPAHIFLKDRDRRHILQNRSLREWRTAAGVDPGDDASYRHHSLETASRLAWQDDEVLRTGVVISDETVMTGPDGSRQVRCITKFPIYDDSGEITGLGGISLDITGEHEAREAAAQVKRYLEAIIDHAPGAIFLKDLNSRFVLANRYLRERLRTNPGEPIEEAAQREIGSHESAPFRDHDRDVIRTRAAVVRETVIPAGGDRGRTIRMTKFPVFDDRQNVAFIGGIALDVTSEREARDAVQEAKRQLEAIIDNAPALICLKDRDGRYILQNRKMREECSFGCMDAAERHSCMRYSPEVAAQLDQMDMQVIESGAVVTDEIVTTALDGKWARLRVIKFPVYDEQKTVTAVGGFALDVTEQYQLQERLRHTQRIEAVGQLTGGIAHDFNNLFEVILGNAEMLIEDLADAPAKRRMAELIQKAAARAATLTHRMLAFSRQQELKPETVDCSKLISSLTQLLTRTIGVNIELIAEFPPEPWHVWVDRGELEASLINLVVNARDAMPNGGPICLRAENIQCDNIDVVALGDLAPGDYVRISVTDVGIGMSPKVLERAFDPYFTTKEVGKGTGLGLSMVHGFVKQSGGHIAIESTEGAGTTVAILLPRAEGGSECASESYTQPVEPRSFAKPVVLPGGSETLLVVEDEPMVRGYVAAELGRLGYRVLEARDGQEALAALHSDPAVELLFTDMVMPGGMPGNELAERARAIRPNLKVLFTTGYASTYGGKPLSYDHAVPVLRKPYPRRDLAECVRRCLDAT